MSETNVLEHNAKPGLNDLVAVFDHVEERWENSTDRVPVFSVVMPNPKAGQLIAEEAPGSVGDNGELIAGSPATYEPATITVTHTMPRKPNAGLGLAYLKRARREGPDVAGSWLIELAVGAEAYDDLTDELAGAGDEGPQILQDITKKIQTIALGGLEAPKA
jgi:hypothetical protein